MTARDLFRLIFDSHEFMPHGHCYFWRPGLVWLHASSDSVIGIAYVTISILLWALIKRIRIPFSPIIWAFGVFILACGCTHLMEVWTLWTPNYWLAGGIKAVTALASIATAIALIPSRPRVIELAESAALAEARRLQLEQKNAELGELYARLQFESEERLKESEQQFRTLVDNLPQLAWTARPDGAIDFYNQRWYEYTGTTFEKMKGWGWQSVHDPQLLPEVLLRWDESLKTGEPFEMEFPLKGADGTFRWFLTRVRPLRNSSGQITRWVGTNTNVDDQRRTAQQMHEAIQARDTFLSIASHELKTPLTPLALRLQAFRRKLAVNEPVNRERVSQDLEVMLRQLHRLTSLINELLDVGRLATGNLQLQPEEVNLGAFLRELTASFAQQAAQVGSTLDLEGPGDVVGMWDVIRLSQVVGNLLSNAIKYGEGKPIHLSWTVEGKEVRLAVRDGGIGIPKEALERIFEKFERAVSERHYGGLGLGLYVCRSIVGQCPTDG